MMSPARAERLHSITLYGSGIVTLLIGFASGRMEAGLVAGALCWLPSMIVRAANRQWRRAVLTGILVAVVAAGGLVSIAIDRETPKPSIWTPGPSTNH